MNNNDLSASFQPLKKSLDKLHKRWRYRAAGKQIGELAAAIEAAVRTGALELEAQLAVIDLDSLLARMMRGNAMPVVSGAHRTLRAFAERWNIQLERHEEIDVVKLDAEGHAAVIAAMAAQQAWQATGDPRAWHDCKICEALERQKARTG